MEAEPQEISFSNETISVDLRREIIPPNAFRPSHLTEIVTSPVHAPLHINQANLFSTATSDAQRPQYLEGINDTITISSPSSFHNDLSFKDCDSQTENFYEFLEHIEHPEQNDNLEQNYNPEHILHQEDANVSRDLVDFASSKPMMKFVCSPKQINSQEYVSMKRWPSNHGSSPEGSTSKRKKNNCDDDRIGPEPSFSDDFNTAFGTEELSATKSVDSLNTMMSNRCIGTGYDAATVTNIIKYAIKLKDVQKHFTKSQTTFCTKINKLRDERDRTKGRLEKVERKLQQAEMEATNLDATALFYTLDSLYNNIECYFSYTGECLIPLPEISSSDMQTMEHMNGPSTTTRILRPPKGRNLINSSLVDGNIAPVQFTRRKQQVEEKSDRPNNGSCAMDDEYVSRCFTASTTLSIDENDSKDFLAELNGGRNLSVSVRRLGLSVDYQESICLRKNSFQRSSATCSVSSMDRNDNEQTKKNTSDEKQMKDRRQEETDSANLVQVAKIKRRRPLSMTPSAIKKREKRKEMNKKQVMSSSATCSGSSNDVNNYNVKKTIPDSLHEDADVAKLVTVAKIKKRRPLSNTPKAIRARRKLKEIKKKQEMSSSATCFVSSNDANSYNVVKKQIPDSIYENTEVAKLVPVANIKKRRPLSNTPKAIRARRKLKEIKKKQEISSSATSSVSSNDVNSYNVEKQIPDSLHEDTDVVKLVPIANIKKHRPLSMTPKAIRSREKRKEIKTKREMSVSATCSSSSNDADIYNIAVSKQIQDNRHDATKLVPLATIKERRPLSNTPSAIRAREKLKQIKAKKESRSIKDKEKREKEKALQEVLDELKNWLSNMNAYDREIGV